MCIRCEALESQNKDEFPPCLLQALLTCICQPRSSQQQHVLIDLSSESDSTVPFLLAQAVSGKLRSRCGVLCCTPHTQPADLLATSKHHISLTSRAYNGPLSRASTGLPFSSSSIPAAPPPLPSPPAPPEEVTSMERNRASNGEKSRDEGSECGVLTGTPPQGEQTPPQGERSAESSRGSCLDHADVEQDEVTFHVNHTLLQVEDQPQQSPHPNDRSPRLVDHAVNVPVLADATRREPPGGASLDQVENENQIGGMTIKAVLDGADGHGVTGERMPVLDRAAGHGVTGERMPAMREVTDSPALGTTHTLEHQADPGSSKGDLEAQRMHTEQSKEERRDSENRLDDVLMDDAPTTVTDPASPDSSSPTTSTDAIVAGLDSLTIATPTKSSALRLAELRRGGNERQREREIAENELSRGRSWEGGRTVQRGTTTLDKHALSSLTRSGRQRKRELRSSVDRADGLGLLGMPELFTLSDPVSVSVRRAPQRNTSRRKLMPLLCEVVIVHDLDLAPAHTQAMLQQALRLKKIVVDGTVQPLPQHQVVIATHRWRQQPCYRIIRSMLDHFCMELLPRRNFCRLLNAYVDREHYNAISGERLAQIRRAVGSVVVSTLLQQYIRDIVVATRNHAAVAFGPSPYGSRAFMHAAKMRALLRGISFVRPNDVDDVVVDCLSHRLMLKKTSMDAIPRHLARCIMSHLIAKVITPPRH